MTDHLKQVQQTMRIMGPDDTPRERFCVRLIQETLVKLAERAQMMPKACVVAFEWPDGTRTFVVSQDDAAMEAVLKGVMEETERIFEVGQKALRETQ